MEEPAVYIPVPKEGGGRRGMIMARIEKLSPVWHDAASKTVYVKNITTGEPRQITETAFKGAVRKAINLMAGEASVLGLVMVSPMATEDGLATLNLMIDDPEFADVKGRLKIESAPSGELFEQFMKDVPDA